MKEKLLFIFAIAVITIAFVSMPSFFGWPVIKYIVGIIGYVVILFTLAFFISIVGSPTKEQEDLLPNNQGEQASRFSLFINKFKTKTINNTGFSFFLALFLIVAVGVFDSYMSNHNECSQQCDCKCNCCESFKGADKNKDHICCQRDSFSNNTNKQTMK